MGRAIARMTGSVVDPSKTRATVRSSRTPKTLKSHSELQSDVVKLVKALPCFVQESAALLFHKLDDLWSLVSEEFAAMSSTKPNVARAPESKSVAYIMRLNSSGRWTWQTVRTGIPTFRKTRSVTEPSTIRPKNPRP